MGFEKAGPELDSDSELDLSIYCIGVFTTIDINKYNPYVNITGSDFINQFKYLEKWNQENQQIIGYSGNLRSEPFNTCPEGIEEISTN